MSEQTGRDDENAEAATATGANLGRILRAWNTIVQTGDTRDLGAILDDDVVWQGALPESVSRGRDAVLGVLEGNEAPHLTHIELWENGDRVLLVMHGPDFPRTAGHVGGQRMMVYTLREGRVTRIETIGRKDRAPA